MIVERTSSWHSQPASCLFTAEHAERATSRKKRADDMPGNFLRYNARRGWFITENKISNTETITETKNYIEVIFNRRSDVPTWKVSSGQRIGKNSPVDENRLAYIFLSPLLHQPQRKERSNLEGQASGKIGQCLFKNL